MSEKKEITKEQAAVAVMASAVKREVMSSLSVDLLQLANSAVAAAIKDTEPPPAPSSRPWRENRHFDYVYRDLRRMVLNPVQQSGIWRKGKGPRLGLSWMVRNDNQNKLLVEQYGNECCILRKLAKGIPQENGQRIVFDLFKFTDGTLEEVMANLGKQGWRQAEPPVKHQIQLALLEGVTA